MVFQLKPAKTQKQRSLSVGLHIVDNTLRAAVVDQKVGRLQHKNNGIAIECQEFIANTTTGCGKGVGQEKYVGGKLEFTRHKN